MPDINITSSGIQSTNIFIGPSGVLSNFEFELDDYSTSYDFNFGLELTSHKILKVSSNNFVSIWADPDLSLHTGRFYISTESDLNIVDTSTHSVVNIPTTSGTQVDLNVINHVE